MNRHYYLELKDGEKVLKRRSTTLAREYQDRQFLELHKQSHHEIYFVASSEKEKVIN